MKSQELLRNSNVSTRLPAKNLERARAFYAEKLGLEPIEERPGGLRYTSTAAWPGNRTRISKFPTVATRNQVIREMTTAQIDLRI